MLHFLNTDYDYATKMDIGKFVSLEYNIPSILTSWMIAQIQQITDFFYFNVTKEVGFSDYVAYSAYGEHSYWWIVKVYNGILEETEITEGRILKLPTINALTILLSEIKSKQTLYENEYYDSLPLVK